VSADGLGPFDNDGALDLCDELHGMDPGGAVELLRSAWSTVTEIPVGEYLEKPMAEAAVAASALALAKAVNDIQTLDRVELADAIPDIDSQMRAEAVSALARVLEHDSELLGLWIDAGAGEIWRSQIEEMSFSLQAL
jgi:hypothetical protein